MDVEKIKEILYEENIKNAVHKIREISDSKSLHILIDNYNWDDGFEIPSAVIENPYCDLGTALLIFYLADGYSMISDKNYFENHFDNEWKNFLKKLYLKIIQNDFSKNNIEFIVPLTKVQIYKLKKNNPQIPKVLVNNLAGEKIDSPILY